MKSFDITVIGSGPGGYIAALYASRHKLSVCVIERGDVGGACLNRGCIPTKTFLHSASLFTAIKKAPAFGIDTDGCRINFPAMVTRKNDVVQRLRAGIETLFRAAKIELIRGTARMTGPGSVTVDTAGTISAAHSIIATGARPAALPGVTFDHTHILSSDSILDLAALPASIIIIGGGVIGCEFAHLFHSLGVETTIVELADHIVPVVSGEASRKLAQSFTKRGIRVKTSSSVSAVTRTGDNVTVTLASGEELVAAKALISIGRSPATDGLGLQDLGIRTEKGRVIVGEDLRTTAAGVYAIGDCVIGPQLAHKASYDGLLAVDSILGTKRTADYSNIPTCVWTDPEIACVGLSEEDAKARIADVRVVKFPFLASGKAYLSGSPEGYVKIVGDRNGAILGVEIMGTGACELIAEAVLARSTGITVQQWSRIVHAHPTLSEALQEAAQIFSGTPIHAL